LCASSSGPLICVTVTVTVTVNPETQLATLHKFMKFVTNLPPRNRVLSHQDCICVGWWLNGNQGSWDSEHRYTSISGLKGRKWRFVVEVAKS
jgi:hypothetical protein